MNHEYRRHTDLELTGDQVSFINIDDDNSTVTVELKDGRYFVAEIFLVYPAGSLSTPIEGCIDE